MYATYAASILGAFTRANFDVINTLNREFDKQKAEIVSLKEELEQLKRKHENRFDEIQVKNAVLSEELQREKTVNATLVQKVALLERQLNIQLQEQLHLCIPNFPRKNLKSLPFEPTRNTKIWSMSYLKL